MRLLRRPTPRQLLLDDHGEAVMHVIENTKLVEFYSAMVAMHTTRIARITKMLEQHPSPEKGVAP